LDIDLATEYIYVANVGNNSGDSGNVTVINGATNSPVTLTDPKAQHPCAVAVNPTTHKVYVANPGSNNVTVIEGAHTDERRKVCSVLFSDILVQIRNLRS